MSDDLQLDSNLPEIAIADGTIVRPGDEVTALWYGTGRESQSVGNEDPAIQGEGEQLPYGARFYTFRIIAIGARKFDGGEEPWLWENVIDARLPSECYANLKVAVGVAIERAHEEHQRLMLLAHRLAEETR